MDKEKLMAIYNEWPDDKLIEEYKKVKDYEPIAAEAMITVMHEKGLGDEIKKLDTELANEEAFLEKKELEEVLISKFAYAGSEESFAKVSKNKSGVYFEKKLYTSTQLVQARFTRSIIFSLIGLDMIIGLLFYQKDMGIPVLLAVLLLAVYIGVSYVIWSKRITFILAEENNSLWVRLLQNKEVIKEIEAPFDYSYFYVQESDKNKFVEGGGNYLILSIKDRNGAEPIELVEASSKNNGFTKDWKLETGGLDNFSFEGTDEWLSISGELKVGIEKLVRILNGIRKENKLD